MLQVEQPQQEQAYNISTTATALVDLSGATEQQDSASILYEQPAQQSDLSSSIISLPPAAETSVTVPGITQIPISAFITAGSTIDSGLSQTSNIVGIQTSLSDAKKVQYVAIEKPVKSAALTTYEKPKTKTNLGSYIAGTASVKQHSKLSTLNEIFVWNKGRALIPGETVTQVQVPIIENGTSRMTECSIVFNRFIQEKTAESVSKNVKVHLGEEGERYEEVQTVDGLDDMDFEVYVDQASGNTPAVVTYKRKRVRKVGGGAKSKIGRQMDNYKWRDAQVADDVARELRKSILPDIVKGSPAVAKYLQAMNIPTEDLDEELLKQQTQGSNLGDGQISAEHGTGNVMADNVENCESTESGNRSCTEIIRMDAESAAIDAVNALVEASELSSDRLESEEQIVEETVDTSENVQEHEDLETVDSSENFNDGRSSKTETVSQDEKGTQASDNEFDSTNDNANNNRVSYDDSDDFVKNIGKEDIQTNIDITIEGKTSNKKTKEDGTTDDATDTTESEAENNQSNVRKSHRLQIKKAKSATAHPGSIQVVRVYPNGTSKSETAVTTPPVEDETPFEIAEAGKKYGYFCSVCDKKLPPGTNLIHHLESHRQSVRKGKNGRQGSGDDNVIKISSQPNKVFIYFCSLCNKMFPSEDELKQHCQRHKQENRDKDVESFEDEMDDSDVEMCDEEVQTESLIERPLKRPARSASYRSAKRIKPVVKQSNACNICGKVLGTKAGLYQHLKVHQGSERDLTHHKCPLGCGQRFKTEMEVDLHGPFCLRNQDQVTVKNENEEDVHDEDLTCPHCQKICETRGNLRYHSLVCRDRPFEKCPLCDFTCKGTLPMSRHQVKVHNMKPFKCEECGKTFRLKGSLRDHCAQNHSENKFICEHCGKKFAKNNVYKRHVFVQHGGFRYPCNYCHKKFKDKRCWRIHENSHKGAYEYSCLPCKRSFSKAPDYKQHMLEAHNIQGKEALDLNKAAKELREKLCKIACSLCKEKFPLESAFLHHLKAKHMLSEEAAMLEYQRVSGNEDIHFEEEFEKLQKGETIGEPIDNV